MAIEQRPEFEKELGEIRKEVIEARNLVIKTDNLLKNLHAELKAVSKRQEDFQRRQWISSAVAYALFAGLCLGGALAISSARTSTASAERERLEKAVAELTGQLDKQRTEQAAVASSQRAAGEVYKLMTTLPGDERLKGIDALVKLDTSRLTMLERQALTDRAAVLRKEAGEASYERGRAAYRRTDMQAVVTELSRFVAMNPPEADLLEASYYLGHAYNHLRKHEQAVPLLSRFVEGSRRGKQREYAMLLLANSLQETGQPEKGANLMREAIGANPSGELVPQMKFRLASIKRTISGTSAPAEEAAAAPAAVAPPATAAPAPR